MKTLRPPLAPLALFAMAVACESVPNDQGSGLFPPTGAVRGNVVYSGPHPCSSNGHIRGVAFNRLGDQHREHPFGQVLDRRLMAFFTYKF